MKYVIAKESVPCWYYINVGTSVLLIGDVQCCCGVFFLSTGLSQIDSPLNGTGYSIFPNGMH